MIDTECRGYGGEVTRQFVRVFGSPDPADPGDSVEAVWGCPTCLSTTELLSGGYRGSDHRPAMAATDGGERQ